MKTKKKRDKYQTHILIDGCKIIKKERLLPRLRKMMLETIQEFNMKMRPSND